MISRKDIVVQQFTHSTPSMKESWEIQKTKLKERYPNLTDHDLRYDEGKKGAMWDKIKKKLGLNQDELHKIIISG